MEIDLFALALVFIPRIHNALLHFTKSWNLHPMRTEHNWSPKKIWMNGMIDPVNQGQLAVRDVYDLVPDDVETFGVDDYGPLPSSSVESVEIPVTSVPLSNEQIGEITSQLETYAGEFGVEAYLDLRHIVHSILS